MNRQSRQALRAGMRTSHKEFSRVVRTTIGSILLSLAAFGYITIHASYATAGDGVFSGIASWFNDDIINGKGTTISTDGFGRTSASWSNGRDKLKVRIDGDVSFSDDDRAIRRISRGGYLAIWEKRGAESRELKVTVGRDGEFEYSYRMDDKETPFDDSGEAWLAEVLLDIIRKTGIGAEERANHILDREGVVGLLEEVQNVESDYVMRLYLGAALARPDLTTSDCASILEETAIAMDSDYEKAELLLSVARHPNWNSSLAAEFVGVASTMESDYEIRRCLSAVELDENTAQEVVDAVLQVTMHMESDYEVAELLIGLAPSCNGSIRLSEMYVRAASRLESDYEARRALTELNWRKGLSTNTIVGALVIAGGLDSDYEAAELLIELAPYSGSDEGTTRAFMSAVGLIHSDYEAARSLTEFASADQLSESTALAALQAAKQISSSYEQSTVLRKLLRHCRGSHVLEDAYLDAVDTIDADYERETLLSEFYRGDREARRARRGE